MGPTQYIGARYVPMFANPIEWSSSATYEPLTIVTHEGNSYTSKQFVPKGIDITNEQYWAATGNYNAQVEQYRREVADMGEYVQDNVDEMRDYVQDNVGARTLLFANTYEMAISDLLYDGAVCLTAGFHSANDGGNALYVISSTGSANGFDVIACGNFYAHLIIDDTTTVDALGAYGNGLHDDYAVISYCANTFKTIKLNKNKTYLLSETLHIGEGASIIGNDANIHGTSSTVIEVQTYTSSQLHNSKPVSIQHVNIYGNNANTLINLNKALKVTVDNCNLFNFMTGIIQTAGYEAIISNLRMENDTVVSGCIGLDFITGDSIITNVVGRDIETFIRMQDGSGRLYFDMLHAWILKPTLYPNSKFIDDYRAGGRSAFFNNVYFDTYRYCIYKHALCTTVITNPTIIKNATVVSQSGVNDGYVVFFDENVTFDKKFYAGKVKLTNVQWQGTDPTFYTLANLNNIPFDVTFNAIDYRAMQAIYNDIFAHWYTVSEDVTVNQGYVYFDNGLMIFNIYLNVPSGHEATDNVITFNDRVVLKTLTTYARIRNSTNDATIWFNSNYVRVTGSGYIVIQVAVPYFYGV